ncbi:MAG: FG-GAP-like repeat-containing protein [Candidatus Eisenbacteria bacterium]
MSGLSPSHSEKRFRGRSFSHLRFGITALLLAVLTLFPASYAFGISRELLIRPLGGAAYDQFGKSVASAGDVNGDGYDDLIVGAPFNDAGGGDAGGAYLYYGGPSAGVTADLVLTGETASDFFGCSVAPAGDVNGDGYDDLIIGAFRAGDSGEGRAYVYFGGLFPDATADLVLTGEATDDQFGSSVASAGDVNGDGYIDLIVGAEGNDWVGDYAGRAYLYHGGPSADSTADLVFNGLTAGDHFGQSVASAGDVNGDGCADLIVGATGNDTGGSDAGGAYLFYGGPSADATIDLVLTGEAMQDYFGYSVASAGDVNGDGYADMIVGAIYNGAGGLHAGRAYLYHGGPSADGAADLVMTGEAANDYFGASVAPAGDVNRDGYGDLIVGAGGNDAGGSQAGNAYLFYGGPSADNTPDLGLMGETPSGGFGYSVASAGDVDGDGYADLIIGAGYVDAAGTDAGAAYVYSLYPYRLLEPNGGEQWVAGEPATVRWRGHDPADLSISYDGGSSWNTLAVGAGGLSENEHTLIAPAVATEHALARLSYTGQGAAIGTFDRSDEFFRIVLPAPPPAAVSRLQIAPIGEEFSENLGFSVASAGDVNGDGYADMIVGATGNNTGGSDAGAAYLYHGGPSADTTADLMLTGEAADDYFGISVAPAGDVNGDGYPDLIVGAHGNDAGGSSAGRAYLFHGGPSADTTADLVFTGEAASDYFGYSVASAGDVNGDGYADMIVGANGSNAGGSNAGRAYLYHGGPSADGTADLVFTGEAADDYFGRSVASAGDVNGEGSDDMILGAINTAGGGSNAGRAYLYHGGPSADGAADLVFTGEAADDYFGYSVASAGDMNGDGYADLFVGAPRNDAGGGDAGRAYLYYGGPSCDTTADLVFMGEAAGDWFGNSVASEGDANNDGYPDLIVGALYCDAGGTDAGRAYLYYGGLSADATVDQVFTGETGGDYFGRSVASAGDVNGDGYADLIIGADRNDEGNGNAGRAYLYDCNRYFVTAPDGGEIWNVGTTRTVSWLGREPADVWLSVDGGASYDLLKGGAGGSESNSIPLLVPHQPSRFALIKVTSSDPSIGGEDPSDSLFTIDASVTLLAFKAGPTEDGTSGALLSWETDPGPEELSGYKLEMRSAGSSLWSTLVSLTRNNSHHHREGGAGTHYRLTAVNGLGEEMMLGEVGLRPIDPLSAWPLPYRQGNLSIFFATHGGLGGGEGRAEVDIFDIRGRHIKSVARGEYTAGVQTATWDGRNEKGRKVSTGTYFLRATSAGQCETRKVVVIR